MINLNQIQRPTLLLDKAKCLKNIDAMLARAKAADTALCPHFKTPQSRQIGEWFRERGVDKITVSSLEMAEYFAAADWRDITVAFPLNIREMERVNDLASRIQLNLLIESTEVVEALDKGLKHAVHVFIKIDLGTNRSGVAADNFEEIDTLLDLIGKAKLLTFSGFLAHAGHSYAARGEAEIMQVQFSSLELMNRLKSRYSATYPNLELSLGDTPCCSVAKEWPGIDELRPGNFAFYDLMQWQIGACSLNDIAVALAAPVVAKHPERNEIVLYGGGVHLSKDRLELAGKTIYGLVAKLTDKGWELPIATNYLRSVSQEHGIAVVSADFMAEIQVGDLLAILPVHSCMTADLMGSFMDFDGQKYDHFSGQPRN